MIIPLSLALLRRGPRPAGLDWFKGGAVAIPIRPAGMSQLIRGKWTGSPQPKYRPPLEALSKRVSDRLLPRRRPGPSCGLMKVEALCVVQRSVGNAMVGGRAEISVRRQEIALGTLPSAQSARGDDTSSWNETHSSAGCPRWGRSWRAFAARSELGKSSITIS